jgi:hypothetical protein
MTQFYSHVGLVFVPTGNITITHRCACSHFDLIPYPKCHTVTQCKQQQQQQQILATNLKLITLLRQGLICSVPHMDVDKCLDNS